MLQLFPVTRGCLGISISRPVYPAAALWPLVLQPGPFESARIGTMGVRLEGAKNAIGFLIVLQEETREPHPKCGVASGVIWVQNASWVVGLR